jgi:two-component system, NarL family, response regulator NreC
MLDGRAKGVLIVDDHRIVRAGIRLLLEATTGLEVTADVGSVDEALAAARERKPDIALVDLSLPGRSGLELIAQLERSGVRVIAVTMHDDDEHLRAVVEAGGCGYVVKSAADVELIAAIRTVLDGRSYFSLPLEVAVSPVRREAPRGTRLDGLSPREREVLRGIANGLSNAEIANALGISVRTVETHRTGLTSKTGKRTRAELVRLAIEDGLLEP